MSVSNLIFYPDHNKYSFLSNPCSPFFSRAKIITADAQFTSLQLRRHDFRYLKKKAHRKIHMYLFVFLLQFHSFTSCVRYCDREKKGEKIRDIRTPLLTDLGFAFAIRVYLKGLSFISLAVQRWFCFFASTVYVICGFRTRLFSAFRYFFGDTFVLLF